MRHKRICNQSLLSGSQLGKTNIRYLVNYQIITESLMFSLKNAFNLHNIKKIAQSYKNHE